MIRRILLLIVLFVIWAAALGWAAGVPWNAPMFPRQRVALAGAEFHVLLGSGANDANGLAVNALGTDGIGLQSASLNRLRAEDFPMLRYRVANFPDTLELSLVFRRADTPNDVQTISIPAPGGGDTCLNLTTLPDWHGEIIEFGFEEFATAQLVPPSAATFKPFLIEDVQLQSSAWAQVFSRLRSDWFGYRPWALRSINTLGPQIATLQFSWMQPVVAFGALLSVFAAWLILRWSRQRTLQAAAYGFIAVWTLLDLRWLDDFVAKHRVIEQLFADKSREQRAQLQPDEDTLAAAAETSRVAAAQGVKRVLVLSDSSYTLLRFIYFLLPLNATPMLQTLNTAPGTPLPREALIAVFDSVWSYNAATGSLSDGTTLISVVPVYAKGDLRVFRARAAAQ